MKFSQKHRRYVQKRRKNRACQQKKPQQKKKRWHRENQGGRHLVFRLYKTIRHHIPDLYERMREIPECRQQSDYNLVEILMAGLAMFLFKKESRHAMNNEREDPEFRSNYERIFNMRLPHMDTVEHVMRLLEEAQLETLKAAVVKALLTKKTFRQYRLFGRYYRVAVDGTHVITVKKGHCPSCLHRTLKNGTVMYFHVVLEAKLVCDNGWSISLGTEWIENSDEYDKQDCELSGFKRLAQKLKRYYPRLPLCLVADSLYPNAPCFHICQDMGWTWIVTLKKGSLPSVWKAVLHCQGVTRCRSRHEHVWKGAQEIFRRDEWHADLLYQGFTVHWWECVERSVSRQKESVTTFVYLTNLDDVGYQTMVTLTATGRMRWKIENEGFDVQKHHGYGLGHQYSRCSMLAMKNYYQLMQLAHLINQLFELSPLLLAVRGSKESLKQVWQCLVGELRQPAIDFAPLTALLARRIQMRYD